MVITIMQWFEEWTEIMMRGGSTGNNIKSVLFDGKSYNNNQLVLACNTSCMPVTELKTFINNLELALNKSLVAFLDFIMDYRKLFLIYHVNYYGRTPHIHPTNI